MLNRPYYARKRVVLERRYVKTTAEDAAKTDIQERKDQFLRTVERLMKPSGKKETCYRRRKEKRTGMEKVRC